MRMRMSKRRGAEAIRGAEAPHGRCDARTSMRTRTQTEAEADTEAIVTESGSCNNL